MPYQVADDPPLQVLKKRYEKLPTGYSTRTTLLHMLGHNHTTHQFMSQLDGSSELTFHDINTYDSFALSIHMLHVSFNIDLKKNHKEYYYVQDWQNGNIRVHKSQGFAVTIGDLFRLFHKQNPSVFERKKSSTKKGDASSEDDDVRQAEREEEEHDRTQIIKLTMKALKLTPVITPDPQHILGALMTNPPNHLRLWTLLIKDGLMKNRGNDFTSFCNTLVILPLYRYEPKVVLEDLIASVATYDLMRKIVRYYLYVEDPEVSAYPVREYFNQPKTLADICALYSDQHHDFARLRQTLIRGLNNKGKAMLQDEKYSEPVYFNTIEAVEDTYPLYALRNVYLNSWRTTEDIDRLRTLIETAQQISRSDRCKHIIKKRGKFGKYADYEDFGAGGWYDYKPKERKQKYKFVKDAST